MLERIDNGGTGSRSRLGAVPIKGNANRSALADSVVNDANGLMHFDRIGRYVYGTGFCYVRDGAIKRTKADKPYVVLYLADPDGMVLPGYLFDIEDNLQFGTDLSNVIGHVVQVKWEENFLKGSRLTLRLFEVQLATNVQPDILSMFVGTVEDTNRKIDEILAWYREVTGHTLTFPYHVHTLSTMEYSEGKVGGLAEHYYQLHLMIKAYRECMSQDSYRKLVNACIIYMVVHTYYVQAKSKGEADINLVTELVSIVRKVYGRILTTEGIYEVAHILVGYEPKDLFVKIVYDLSETLRRHQQAISVWRSLPDSTDGYVEGIKLHKYAEHRPEGK